MPLPTLLESRLRVPVIAAPMFLVSGPALVAACCKSGIVGSFPALNARTTELFDEWLEEIASLVPNAGLDAAGDTAPYGVNLILHRSNPRLGADLDVVVARRVPLILTSIGDPAAIVERVHDYGGLVFHDVTTIRHARKAAAAGADGLILVCAGAGGHAGTMNPFAFVPQVREFFDGTIVLAGCLNDGRGIRAAEVLGADMAYLGTRFIAVAESMAPATYKDMIVNSSAADILYTPAFSGIPANMLRPSIEAAGLDPDNLPVKAEIDLGKELKADVKAWKNVWSAGQGVGAIHDSPSVTELVARIEAEYRAA